MTVTARWWGSARHDGRGTADVATCDVRCQPVDARCGRLVRFDRPKRVDIVCSLLDLFSLFLFSLSLSLSLSLSISLSRFTVHFKLVVLFLRFCSFLFVSCRSYSFLFVRFRLVSSRLAPSRFTRLLSSFSCIFIRGIMLNCKRHEQRKINLFRSWKR